VPLTIDSSTSGEVFQAINKNGAMDPQRFVFLDSDPDLDPWIKIQGAKYQPKPVITKFRYTLQH